MQTGKRRFRQRFLQRYCCFILVCFHGNSIGFNHLGRWYVVREYISQACNGLLHVYRGIALRFFNKRNFVAIQFTLLKHRNEGSIYYFSCWAPGSADMNESSVFSKCNSLCFLLCHSILFLLNIVFITFHWHIFHWYLLQLHSFNFNWVF